MGHLPIRLASGSQTRFHALERLFLRLARDGCRKILLCQKKSSPQQFARWSFEPVLGYAEPFVGCGRALARGFRKSSDGGLSERLVCDARNYSAVAFWSFRGGGLLLAQGRGGGRTDYALAASL